MKKAFIVGGMKCGTTALYSMLKQHPNILTAREKELHFFSLYYSRGLDWYESQFPQCTNPETEGIGLDASPTYFDLSDDDEIINRMISYDRSTKVILLERDPISRAISHYTHYLKVDGYDFLEKYSPDEFFNIALGCGAIRPTNVERELAERVIKFSLYSDKFLRFQKLLGRKAILVLQLDELKKHPKVCVDRALRHFGLRSLESDIQSVDYFSNDSTLFVPSKETIDLLAERLSPDYQRFRKLAGLLQLPSS